MRMRFVSLVGLLVLWSGPVFADDAYDKCMKESDGTNTSWSECGTALLKREEARLTEAWKKMFKYAQGRDRELLLDEQRAWIAFKDKSCNFNLEDHGREGIVLHFPICRAEVLVQRRKQLLGNLAVLNPEQE